MTPNPNWRARAACLGVDPTLFDPMDGGHGGRPAGTHYRVAAALEVCAACPVRPECLTEALDRGDVGVRGGHYLTAERLAVLRRGRAAA